MIPDSHTNGPSSIFQLIFASFLALYMFFFAVGKIILSDQCIFNSPSVINKKNTVMHPSLGATAPVGLRAAG